MSACLVEEDNKKYIQVHTHTLGAQLFIMLRNVVPCCCCFFFSSRNCEVVSQSIAVEFCQTVPLFLFIFIVVLSPNMLNFGGCRRWNRGGETDLPIITIQSNCFFFLLLSPPLYLIIVITRSLSRSPSAVCSYRCSTQPRGSPKSPSLTCFLF